jgi:AraC-like DNA-binding protein
MELSSTIEPTLFGAAAVLLLFVFSLYQAWQIRKLRSNFAKQLASTQKEINLINQAHIGMGRRMLSYEKGIREMQEAHSIERAIKAKQPVIKAAPVSDDAEPTAGPYNSAVKLLNKGMSPEDVAKRCGLSTAEAQLMSLVNKEAS